MKTHHRLIIFLTALFFMKAAAISATVVSGDEIEINSIAPDTYIATDKTFYDSNVLVAKMKDGTVLVVSTPYENQGARLLLDWINKTLKPSKIVDINTHFHPDGTGGNEVFNAAGVETWSSDLTKELLLTEGLKVLRSGANEFKDPALKKRIADLKLTPAKHLFRLKEGKKFQFGGETVEIYFPGEAHSADNVVVYLDQRKILFGGCMIKVGENLGWLKYANVDAWPTSAKNLERFDPDIVVPGHGRWGGKDFIAKTILNAKRGK